MKKIQTKIMVLIILATIGVSVVSSVQSIVITKNSTISAIEKNLMETTELAALAAQNMISTYTLTVAEIAANPTLSSNRASVATRQEFIEDRVAAYYMRMGGMADARGYDVIHDADVSEEPFFQAAMAGENYMSTPYFDGDDIYLVVSAPIMEDGQVQGVVYFQCDTNVLQSIVEGIQVGEEGEAYILDKEGNTIACVDEQLVLEQENVIRQAAADPGNRDLQVVAAVESKMVAGESGVERYTYYADNSHNIQGYAPIAGTDGWSVAVNISEDEFMRSAYMGNNIQIAVCAALCIVVILISFGVSRSIAGPVVKCADRLRGLAEGDLRSAVPSVKGRDETRILSDSTAHLVQTFDRIVNEIETVLGNIANGNLSDMSISDQYPGDFRKLHDYLEMINDKLNDTLGGIVAATGRVSRSSAQMASSSGALSQGAVSQASAVEQLSMTIGRMEQDAHETAQLAQEAKNAMNSAGVHLEESSQYIQKLNEAMNLITRSSNEISRIIDAIEGIAFQTNILAINASVEAAHAGEAGKGFAVVAGEVRDLASKSDQAAKATKELIQHSIEAVGSGSEVVEKVTESVTEVVVLTNQAAEQMGVVAEAVGQQTTAIEQVTIAVGQISNVVQTNSATAQESAANSEELSGQANVLERLVGNFRLRRR